MQQPIGIFDSGIGGLAVWRALKTKLPEEQLVYYADTAFMPFGSKPVELIRERTRLAVQYFLAANSKLIILACNTASAVALEDAQRWAGSVPVLGVIEPTVNWLSSLSALHQPVLIATARTIESGVFVGSLAQKGLEVKALATPALADFIEAEFFKGPLNRHALRTHLQPALALESSHLILGCTHYALAAEAIQEATGKTPLALDPAPVIALQAQQILLTGQKLHTGLQRYADTFFETGDLTGFRATVSRLQQEIAGEAGTVKPL